MDLEDQQNQMGYSKDLFPNFKGDAYDCTICSKICKLPKQCTGCGRLYCSQCLTNFEKNLGMAAHCLQCEKSQFQQLGQNLRQHYDQLQILCVCNNLIQMGVYQNHLQQCKKNQKKCKNYQICQSFVAPHMKNEDVCDPSCLLYNKIQENPEDWNKIHRDIRDVLNKIKKGDFNIVIQQQQQPQQIQKGVQQQQQPYQQPYQQYQQQQQGFTWSPVLKGTGIQLHQGQTTCFLRESCYIFRTVLGSVPLNGGRHYWEIIPDPQTENEMKIGIVKDCKFSMDTAFCDTQIGYAFYGLGSLRNGSNSSGSGYGKKFKNSGVLGVYLNMDAGKLYFSIQGQNQGLAYQNVSLKSGPIYPAIALLHVAGATLKAGLPIPPCFQGC